ncbi:MAG: type VI secretion system-associated protein TagF [Oceanobacter sp.]|jgi:type VI secretion system protein ImpM|nr:MAG: type VI secretion system-associated protein TagF [Oceanobacter sp.]
MSTIGLFGKLPAHGDFISRHLPSSFISVWDEWLQLAVSGSRELQGDAWLDNYLTSPIWRFALRSGAVNESAWVGILVPSVDSVGRYFPLTIALSLPASTNLFKYVAKKAVVFEALEAAALSTLQEQLDADQLMSLLEGQVAAIQIEASSDLAVYEQGRVVSGGDDDAERYAGLLQHYFKGAASYSVWSASATANSPAATLVADGLPSVFQYGSMLNGYWAE